MTPRPRKNARKKLPEHLYERKDKRTGRTYYAYRGPDGKVYGLGTDKTYAIEQAIDANLRRIRSQPELWARIAKLPTVSEWIEVYRPQLDELSDSTRASANVYLRRLEKELGSTPISEITTLHITKIMDAYVELGKKRSANAFRSRMLYVFQAAQAKGWIDNNPVAVTRAQRVKVQRSRLTLDNFLAIHAAAKSLDPYVQHSMELALVTAQRREDIADMQFSAVEEGYLHVVQRKTGNRVRIPTALRLDAVGWSISDVISRCRGNVLSRYIIHHTKARAQSKSGDAVHIDTLSRSFSSARDLVSAEWESPPTFHEIRSLAARLYDDQGINAQALLGHRDPRSTALYKDRRGAEWIEVKVR